MATTLSHHAPLRQHPFSAAASKTGALMSQQAPVALKVQHSGNTYINSVSAPSPTASTSSASTSSTAPTTATGSALAGPTPAASLAGACAHLDQFLLKSASEVHKLRLAVAYGIKLKKGGAGHIRRTGQPSQPAPKCTTCKRSLSRPLLCLECGSIFCSGNLPHSLSGHAQRHAKAQSHHLYWDLRSFEVFCYSCTDYVHHPEVERIVAGQHAAADDGTLNRSNVPGSSSRKRKDESRSSDSSTLDLIGTAENLHPRGLRNLGQTCYMSVVLQAFLVNPIMRVFFLSDQHNRALCERTESGQPCLLCEMDLLFSECCSSSASPFGPSNFLHTIWKSSPEISGYLQQDAHEFLISTLNLLHSSTPGCTDIDCRCIAHSTFAGSLRSEVKCGRCQNRSHSVDPFLDLSLDLRGGLKVGLPSGANTLEDCLARFTSPERLPARDYVCGTCGDVEHDSTKQLSLLKLPPVLCLQLKRFEHVGNSHKVDTPIRYPLKLDMSKYTSSALSGNANGSVSGLDCMYDLSSIVAHEGTLANGHYTAICRGADDFWCFDDDKCRRAPLSEVLNAKAYLLIYVKA